MIRHSSGQVEKILRINPPFLLVSIVFFFNFYFLYYWCIIFYLLQPLRIILDDILS